MGRWRGRLETIERLLEMLGERTGLERAEVKFSIADEEPFRRLKFKVKREIITFRRLPSIRRGPGSMSIRRIGMR